MVLKRYAAAAAALILILTAGCAGGGGGTERPSWVVTPPADTDESVYFVGIGSDPAGDAAKANQMADSTLLSDVTKFLGVKITAETSSEAREAYGKFESSISQTIKEKSEAKIGDFRIADTYTERGPSGVTVYLLGEYDRAALMEEKARLEALTAEREEAISGPELEGDKLMEQGAYYEAAVKYMEAALAASSSEVDNAAIKFERNTNKAKQAVDSIVLSKENDNLSGFMGNPLGEPFTLAITAGSSSGAPALAEVPVQVSYRYLKRNGRMGGKYEFLKSDENGRIAFTLPVPDFVGKSQVVMALDLRSALEPLEDVPDRFLEQLEGLEQAVTAKRVVFEYEVISKAKEIATAVLIIDTDRSGNPLDVGYTANGVLEVLTGSGFKVAQIPLDYRYTAMSDLEIIQEVRRSFGNRYERLILGSAEVSSFDSSGGASVVKVSGNLKAVELETEQILFSTNGIKRARGSSEASSMASAYRSLGKSLGEDLENNLP